MTCPPRTERPDWVGCGCRANGEANVKANLLGFDRLPYQCRPIATASVTAAMAELQTLAIDFSLRP